MLAVLQVVTAVTAFVFLLACCSPFLHPGQWWVMGVLSVGFIFLAAAMLLLAVCWFFVKKKISILLLLAMLAGLPNLRASFAFGSNNFGVQRAPGTLRIMQFNCMGMNGFQAWTLKHTADRMAVVKAIRQFAPDIICLQDFTVYDSVPNLYSNLAFMRDTLGYQYYLFDDFYGVQKAWGFSRNGIAIFSKLPLANKGRQSYTGRRFPESFIWADVSVAGKPMRIVTTHLQSMHVSRLPGDTNAIEPPFIEDSAIILNKSKLRKLRHFQPYHVQQAKQLRNWCNTQPLPMVLTGDLNSVPASYVYHHVKNNMNDAFLLRGGGLGKSYHNAIPSLRIDFIFSDKRIRINQFKQLRLELSDHDALLADLQWQ